MQTGTINPSNNTFDIAGVGETETSILLTPTQLQLTYRDEAGQLIRFQKAIPAAYYKKSFGFGGFGFGGFRGLSWLPDLALLDLPEETASAVCIIAFGR